MAAGGEASRPAVMSARGLSQLYCSSFPIAVQGFTVPVKAADVVTDRGKALSRNRQSIAFSSVCDAYEISYTSGSRLFVF